MKKLILLLFTIMLLSLKTFATTESQESKMTNKVINVSQSIDITIKAFTSCGSKYEFNVSLESLTLEQWNSFINQFIDLAMSVQSFDCQS